MNNSRRKDPADYQEETQPVGYSFGLRRRSFVQLLGAGVLIALSTPAVAQRRSGGSGGDGRISSRIHLGKDGTITVLTGKVEGGQGARAELTQAAAEELRVPPQRVRMVMADTALTPNDGITAGSRSTPSTVPAVRQGAAAARQALIAFAAQKWGVEQSAIEVRNGKAITSTGRELSYADFAGDARATQALEALIPNDLTLTEVKKWRVMGTPFPRPNGRDLVTGKHQFPSDIARAGMLHAKVLRPESYGARLLSVDLAPAKSMQDVVAVQDDQFVGVAAPTAFQARAALQAIAKTAQWQKTDHPASTELFDYLKRHAETKAPTPFQTELDQAKLALRNTYEVAYVQHAPLEPRAAVAEWQDGALTVWTGTQNPFGCRGELARAFHLSEEKVRVIVPDFGSGFGGKHTAEAAIEAARLARAARKPVSLVWTRQEEFTWAYFRPAAVIELEASLNDKNSLTSWHHININSGRAGIDSPYNCGQQRSTSINAQAPLRQGSYRALAATANNFARESFMDELALGSGQDPLQFRLAHLQNPRLRAVLETAAERFGWTEAFARKSPSVGVGLACGTEKGSFVAACAEIEVQQPGNQILVRRLGQVFECGAVLNEPNLVAQIEGQILMGIGPALREEIQFNKGVIQNASFRRYLVPRFSDVPELDIHVLNRPDLPSVGGGETPIIAISPAIANAVCHATGLRIRSMPIKLPAHRA